VSPGRVQPEIIERHLAALRGALHELRRHQGASARSLRSDTSRRWAIDLEDFEIFAQHIERWLEA
jgi:hypothetical protein